MRVASRLPSEYQEVEYIESTGTQYIDSSVTLKTNTWSDITFMYDAAFNWNMMYGTWNRHCVTLNGSNNFYITGGSTLSYNFTGSINTKYHAIFGQGYAKINNNIKYNSAADNSALNRDLFLFACCDTNATPIPYKWGSYYSQGKIYSCKIYEGTVDSITNSTLVRNFIPAIRKSDSKPGMYDTVTKTFFTNSGSGEFNYGSNIDNKIKGTKNLFENSKTFADCSVRSGWSKSTESDGTVVYHFSRTGATSNSWYRIIPPTKINYADYPNGITVSLDLYVDDISVLNQKCIGSIQTWKDSSTRLGWAEPGWDLSKVESGKWIRVKYTFGVDMLSVVYTSGYSKSDIAYTNFSFQLVQNGSIYIKNIQIEGGTIAHAYSPTDKSFVGNQVPSTYQQVEYLESTGTQWIDTNYNFSNNMIINDVVKFNQFTSNTYNISGISSGGYWGTKSGAWCISGNDTSTKANLGQKYKVQYNIKTQNLYVDNVLVDHRSGSVSSQGTFALFGCKDYSTKQIDSQYFQKMSRYSCQFYDSDTLVRNFIPVIRKSDSKPGMWDTVTKQFFVNQGTGEFTTGPIIK